MVSPERAAQSVERHPNSALGPDASLRSALMRTDVAPDVVVFCDLTLRHALIETGRVWRARSRIPVQIFVAALAQQAELSRHGARVDILMGIGVGQMEAAQHLGAIEPGTCRVLGRNPLVLAVHGPERQPIALVRGSNLDSLLGNGRFGLVDLAIGRTGAKTRAALTAIELWPELETRSLGSENTETLLTLLIEGEVRVAAVYRSDIKVHPSISIAATFPTPAPLVVAALAARARSPFARDFLAFLLDDGFATLKRAGLDAP